MFFVLCLYDVLLCRVRGSWGLVLNVFVNLDGRYKVNMRNFCFFKKICICIIFIWYDIDIKSIYIVIKRKFLDFYIII